MDSTFQRRDEMNQSQTLPRQADWHKKSLKVNRSLNHRDEMYEQELMKILKNMNLSPEAKRKLELVDKDPMARGQLEELVRKNFIER